MLGTGDPRFSCKELIFYPLLVFAIFALVSAAVALAAEQGLVQRGTLPGAMLVYALNFLVFGGGAFLIAIRSGKIGRAELGIAPPRWRWVWLLLAAGVTIVLLPGRIAIAAIAQWLFGGLDAMQNRMDLFAGELSWARFLVTLVGAGIIAPISEELFFRGFFYTALRGHTSMWLAVLISSIVFAAGHYDAAGVVASSLIMGLALALVYEYTRSLWVAIAVHAFNNSLAVVIAYGLLVAGEYLKKLSVTG